MGLLEYHSVIAMHCTQVAMQNHTCYIYLVAMLRSNECFVQY